MCLMEKRVVLVTGCSTGIGLASATRLHSAGWRVLATVRDADSRQRLAGLGIETLTLDLSSTEQIGRSIDFLLKTCTSFDAVFLNAGYAAAGALEDLSTAVFEHQFKVNLFGHLHLLQGLLAGGALKPGSRVIWCGSVLGIAAMPMRGAYAASKAAMESIADTQRIELAHCGVKVSILQPGPILTHFRRNSLLTLRSAVDVDSSRYASAYAATISRLSKEGPATPGTLSADAVAQVLQRCLDSRAPRARYTITSNTKIISWLKRLLSSEQLDRVIRKAAGAEALPPFDHTEVP